MSMRSIAKSRMQKAEKSEAGKAKPHSVEQWSSASVAASWLSSLRNALAKACYLCPQISRNKSLPAPYSRT